MARRSRREGVSSLIAVGVVVLTLFTTSSQAAGKRRMMVGNSLTNGMAELLRELCRDGGQADDEYWGQFMAGASLDWAWLFGRDGFRHWVQQATPSDNLSLQPWSFANSIFGDAEAEFTAAANMYREVLEDSPNCTPFVYYAWGGGFQASDINGWLSRTRDASAGYLEHMTTMLQREFPQNPVYVVPGGPALLLLADSVAAGRVPGYSSLASFFHDDVHLDANGCYFMACVHYACLYRQSPEGLPYQYTFNSGGMFTATTSLTAAQAGTLQRIAWQAAHSYPRSPVSSVPTAARSDTTAPTRPLQLAVQSSGIASATLTLGSPSTDNRTLDGYSVYVNDFFFKHCASPPFVLDGCLPPDSALSVCVRARDTAYNLSSFSDTVTVRTAAIQVGTGLRFDFGAEGSAVKAGWNPVVRSEVYRPPTSQYGFVETGLTLDLYANSMFPHTAAGVNDSLLRDAIGQWDGVAFRVNVANGTYRVNVWVGIDRSAPGGVDIYTEQGDERRGVAVAENTVVADSLQTVVVSDGYLTVTAKPHSDGACVLMYGVELVPLVVPAQRSASGSLNIAPVLVDNARGVIRTAFPVSGVCRVRVVDLCGRTVLESVLSGATGVVPLGDLPSGRYTLAVASGVGSRAYRFTFVK